MANNDYLDIPSWDKRWMIHRCALKAYKKYALPYVKGRLLDIGCGKKPMENFLKDHVTEHVGLDHRDSFHGLERVDVVGSAYDSTLPSESFDTILCSAVLEHLEEPEAAIREAHRLLKPNGFAIYTVPFFWHLHEEPRDFYRFTKYGLEYLFKKADFQNVDLYELSGFWVTWGTMFNYYMDSTLGKYTITRFLSFVLIICNNYICSNLDRIFKAKKFTWMYLLIAKKS